MLRGDQEMGWLAHFALKCSSWTSVNAGTSSRSACSSVGNTAFQSVREGNCLASRNLTCIQEKIWSRVLVRVHGPSVTHMPKRALVLWNSAFLRMILLMMVAICLNGCVVVEQPFSSFFEFYPRFRELVMLIERQAGKVTWPAPSTNNPFQIQVAQVVGCCSIQQPKLATAIVVLAQMILNQTCGCFWKSFSWLHH